jgi:hypothetical protein
VKWAGDVACIGNMRNAYKILARKPEGKRLFRRLSSKWEDDIRMDIKDIGWESVHWIHVAHVRYQWRTLVNTVMSLRVLNFSISFSRITLLYEINSPL